MRSLTDIAIHLSLACIVSAAQADDRVWLIGGGYDLDNSRVQIEQNVLWARNVLQALPGRRDIQVFFNDGDDPAPDVTLWRKPAEDAASLQPLARIYDAYYLNGESVRSNSIAPLQGPATRDTVRTALSRGIGTLEAGSQGLVVYAGHGSHGDRGSLLDLWGGTELSVQDLRAAIATQPPHTRLRFVFTQCHAGGFQKALLPLEAGTSRCGFYAVAADQLAEGCTASLDVADYRGYGTYFFAALAGHARDGGALLTDPDRDHDGRVDPYEAHLYTLRAARSADLPRSSSEQYLLDWEPWYLPLLRVTPQADNPYRDIAVDLAHDLGLVTDPALPADLMTHRKNVQQQIRTLTYRQEQARRHAHDALTRIQTAVEQRWPQARYPRTLGYKVFLERDLGAAQDFIQQHPLYAGLVADQDTYWSLDTAILELQRRVVQFDRIELLQRLARLHDALLTRADDTDRATYTALLDCERQAL